MKNSMIRNGTAILLAICIAACSTGGVSAPSAGDKSDRLKIAEAMFQERCKKSGEFIYRTAENVEGIFLLKIRPSKSNFDEQFAMTDPYGHDSSGESYLKTFFSEFYRTPQIPIVNWVRPVGFRFVEAIDPKDGQRYRYTGRIDEPWRYDASYSKSYRRFVLDRESTAGKPPHYGITYDDISTREDREYWIAGSRLRVVDLQTDEVMAERIGYMMDRGQGNTSGGRSPWLLATSHACPSFPRSPGGHPVYSDQTRNFVVKVLTPLAEKSDANTNN
ncbi:MAG: hypothetical protein IPP41_08665 [Rhodocyclaceae bacterium]|nr:hypothetical protein [Rhodocyclaceae bacterium]